MNVPSDSVNQKLSMTRDNRHQYLETAMVSASESEREMRDAENRGRERRLREAAMRRRLQTLGLGLLVVVAAALVIGAVLWMSSRS